MYMDARDRQAFLDTFTDVCRRLQWRYYAYGLMPNHYHLVIETLEGHLAHTLREGNGVYTQRFNRPHGRVGYILQERYTAVLIDHNAYLLELVRYVGLNPVRARLLRSPAQWRWSS